jgi:beta-lactamase regulating signal transducer with metallopeptidase domain
MSGWTSHLVLGSTGLALTVLATALVLRVWRRAPIPSYRLAVAVLAAALLLPAAQLAARGLGLTIQHPVRALVSSLSAERQPQDAPLLGLSAGVEAVDVAGLGVGADFEAQMLDPALLALALLGQAERSQPEPSFATEAAPAKEYLLARIPWQLVAAGIYGLGLAVALLRTGRRLLHTRRLIARAVPVRDERVLALWREVAAGSPLAERVRLVASEAVHAPACFGLGRPAVVLPASDQLARSRDVLACVLTHELVHLERRDGLVLLGEELLRAVFWFHPAAWWLVARLERLREVSCDLLVVRRTGQRRRYAEALVEYAAWMQAGERILGGRADRPAAVVPWSGSKGQLTRRIEMLLNDQSRQGGRARFVAPAAIGIVFAFLWSGQLALAGCASTKGGDGKQCPHEHATTVAGTGAPGVATVCIGDDGTMTVTHGGTVTGPGATQAAQGATAAAHGACEAGHATTVAAHGVAAAHGASAGPHGVTTSAHGTTVHSGHGVHTTTLGGQEVRAVQVDGHGSTVRLKDGTTILETRGADGQVRALAIAPDGSSLNGQVLQMHGGADNPLAATVQGQVYGLQGKDGATIGIVCSEADETLAAQLGEDKQNVIVVREVVPGSRAERDGLQPHDVILRVDGEGGNGRKLLERARVDLEEGNDVEVIVIRKGDKQPIVLRATPGKTGNRVLRLGEDGKLSLQGSRVETDGAGELGVYGLGGAQAGGRYGGGAGGVGGGKSKAKAYKLGEGGQLEELMLDEYMGDLASAKDKAKLYEAMRDQATAADKEELGKMMREKADSYYRQVDPEQFRETMRKALAVIEQRGRNLTEAERSGALALRGYATQDAQEALERARKALQELTDQQIGEAVERSMVPLKQQMAQKWLEATKARSAEPDASLADLKAKLEATRNALEAQRAQIEDLKAALESMKRERDTSRQLR